MRMSIVLIHGGWHGPWVWDDVASSLRAQGHPTTAVDLPFSGFADDVGAARHAIEEAGPGAVVCAHSYGGLVVSEAARGLPVAHLVYLAAFMVDEGEDWLALWYSVPTLLQAALVLDGPTVTIDPSKAHQSLYGDSPDAIVRAAVLRLRAMPGVERQPHRLPPAWREAPSTYLVCARDRAVDPQVQRTMATHASAIIEWETDHSPFLTRAEDLAKTIAASAGT